MDGYAGSEGLPFCSFPLAPPASMVELNGIEWNGTVGYITSLRHVPTQTDLRAVQPDGPALPRQNTKLGHGLCHDPPTWAQLSRRLINLRNDGNHSAGQPTMTAIWSESRSQPSPSPVPARSHSQPQPLACAGNLVASTREYTRPCLTSCPHPKLKIHRNTKIRRCKNTKIHSRFQWLVTKTQTQTGMATIARGAGQEMP